MAAVSQNDSVFESEEAADILNDVTFGNDSNQDEDWEDEHNKNLVIIEQERVGLSNLHIDTGLRSPSEKIINASGDSDKLDTDRCIPSTVASTPEITVSHESRLPPDKVIRRRSHPMPVYYDEFSGLMTERDKQWIERIQLLQIATVNPVRDDFYYQTYCMRRRINYRTTRVIPSDSRPYESPVSSHKVLGRLSSSSSMHPRQLIDAVSCNYISRNPRIAALLGIEQIYEWLSESELSIVYYMNHSQSIFSLFYSQLSEFLHVSKGRKLVLLLAPLVDDLVTFLLHILFALVRSTQVLDRDVYYTIRSRLHELTAPQCVILLKSLVRCEVSLSPLMRTRFGLTLLFKIALVSANVVTSWSNSDPVRIILEQYMQMLCSLIAPIETRNIQIPFEPVEALTETFQRFLGPSLSYNVYTKLEYLEVCSFDNKPPVFLNTILQHQFWLV